MTEIRIHVATTLSTGRHEIWSMVVPDLATGRAEIAKLNSWLGTEDKFSYSIVGWEDNVSTPEDDPREFDPLDDDADQDGDDWWDDDSHLAQWDDDPSPYDGNYSEM